MSDVNTKEIDFARVHMLLDVIQKQVTVAPRATHLGQAAFSELMKINDAIREAAVQRPSPGGGDPAEPEPDEDLEETLDPEPTPARRI